MRKYAAAGLVLTVLLFGGAYLTAGEPAAEPEPAAPELTDDEARLQDLLALFRATSELIREQRDLLGYYDSEAELFGEEPPFG